SDLYSLGVVLYQLLIGRLPFEGSPQRLPSRKHELPPPALFDKDLDPDLEAIVRKAVARRPEDRFGSACGFAEALGRWQAGHTTPAPADATKTTAIRSELPDGSALTVTLHHGAEKPGKIALAIREVPGGRKRRKRWSVKVLVTFVLLLSAGLLPALFLT